MKDPLRKAECRKYEKNEDSHVTFGQLEEPPHKSFAEVEQTGVPDHSVVSRVKRFMQCGRGHRHFALASSYEPFVGRNQTSTDNSFTQTIKPQSQSENVEKTCQKIAEVIQTFPEFRFQILGARNFAVAAVKNTERLKNTRADDDAHVIPAHKEHTGD